MGWGRQRLRINKIRVDTPFFRSLLIWFSISCFCFCLNFMIQISRDVKPTFNWLFNEDVLIKVVEGPLGSHHFYSIENFHWSIKFVQSNENWRIVAKIRNQHLGLSSEICSLTAVFWTVNRAQKWDDWASLGKNWSSFCERLQAQDLAHLSLVPINASFISDIETETFCCLMRNNKQTDIAPFISDFVSETSTTGHICNFYSESSSFC